MSATPDAPEPAGQVPPAPPYFQYERRMLEDSTGRRIEFRQLLPGSPDPGPAHFHEYMGFTSVTLMVNGMPSRLPVTFNIPGVRDALEAFRVFDAMADRARVDAVARAEARLRAQVQEAAARIFVPAGADAPAVARIAIP